MSGLVMSIAMVIAPTLGYLDQYRLIRQQQTSEGFNSITCAILLVSNILRVFFWFGEQFDPALLVQSIVMIVIQLVLLETVVKHRPAASEKKPGHFRQSTGFVGYTNYLFSFTTLVAVAYKCLGRQAWFVQTLGFFSLGLESTLPVPQCISVYKTHSTTGFSSLVMASWFLGDGFKLVYFIVTSAPLQFSLCGAIQLSVDMLIVFQALIYYLWLPRRTKEQTREHLSPYEEIP